MTSAAISRGFCLVFLCVQVFACPAYAQDWFLSRTEQLLPVRYADPEELASLLGTMVPDASISVEQGGLMVRGTPGQIDLVLLHKTFPANLGESGRLSLSASESDVQIELWYRPVFREPNKIQSHIQIAIVGTRRPYTFHRDFKDGETVCIKGFLPTQNVRGEAAEVVLMLTPHLMR